MFIRRATRGEAGQITDVHDAAFGHGPDSAQAQLVVDLRADGDLIPELSLVAIEDELVVGHVAISPADVGGRHVAALGPLGVIPSRHRSGVGSALMHAVLAAADADASRSSYSWEAPIITAASVLSWQKRWA